MALTGQSKNDEKFLLKSLDVFVDDDTQPTFYTRGEKSLSFSPEFAEFVEGVPAVLVRKDLTRYGIAVAFNIMQFTAAALELSRGGEKVDGGDGYDYVYYGTDYIEAVTHQYRFVGSTVDDKGFELWVLKGSISDMPDLTTGSGDYADVPVVIEALKDSTVVDLSRNLAYFKFEQ